MSSSVPRSSARGRPVATSHRAIEQAAFELFAERGFEQTTLTAIAERVGVGRRTLFRYFESKNDIPWGLFDQTLAGFGGLLAAQPDHLPPAEAVHRAVVEFNRYPERAQPHHWERMRLILTTPELQAHSALRYAAWRTVVTEFVAERLELSPDDLLPRAAGHVSLALALSAYEAWMLRPDRALTDLVDEAMGALGDYLHAAPPGPTDQRWSTPPASLPPTDRSH